MAEKLFAKCTPRVSADARNLKRQVADWAGRKERVQRPASRRPIEVEMLRDEPRFEAVHNKVCFVSTTTAIAMYVNAVPCTPCSEVLCPSS
jgi:hypothetical protein